MKVETIRIPENFRFVYEIYKEGYYDFNSRKYPHIVDKVVPGCGFTDFSLMCRRNVILCSPGLGLLESKYLKFSDTSFLFNPKSINLPMEYEDEVMSPENYKLILLSDQLKGYINARNQHFRPYKILVTYDNFRYLKMALGEELLSKFQIVVDEYQTIITESKYRIGQDLLSQLEGLENVCYVSSTPNLEKYLDNIEPFKDLPLIRFDWEDRDFYPEVSVVLYNNMLSEVKKIVTKYRNIKLQIDLKPKRGKKKVNKVVSDEAIFYVNSVKDICKIVRYCELLPEECTVHCPINEKNALMLTNAFNYSCRENHLKYPVALGSFTTQGKRPKMFTFFTKSYYLGMDLYSENARTYIFSDLKNYDPASDISIDIQNILGRQRLRSNPWKEAATVYVRNLNPDSVVDRFKDHVNSKRKNTENVLKAVKSVKKADSKKALLNRLSVSSWTDYVISKGGEAKVDEFSLASDLRAIDLRESKSYTEAFNLLDEEF